MFGLLFCCLLVEDHRCDRVVRGGFRMSSTVAFTMLGVAFTSTVVHRPTGARVTFRSTVHRQPPRARVAGACMSLADWPASFDNSLLRDLRAESPHLSPTESRGQILDAHYTAVRPAPAPDPTLVAYSPDCGRMVGLEPHDYESDEFLRIFSGNLGEADWDTWATIYGVHGSGRFGGQRGDGRAISIGQVGGNEIQLKGAGRTPYSRRSDGRAVLRSTIREFLASEHMHALGVPTTRSLCVIASGARVMRSWYYVRDGVAAGQRPEQPVQRLRAEPGAIGTRVASSFLGFGQLELFWQRRDYRLLREVVEHALSREFFHLNVQLFSEPLTERLVEMIRTPCNDNVTTV